MGAGRGQQSWGVSRDPLAGSALLSVPLQQVSLCPRWPQLGNATSLHSFCIILSGLLPSCSSIGLAPLLFLFPSDSLAHIYDLNSSHFLWVLHISLTIWCWYSIQDDSKWGHWAQRPALLRKSDEGIMIQKPLRKNVSELRWNGKLTESSEQICFPSWPEEHKGKPWQDALCKGHAVWRKWVVANPQVNPCNFLGLLPIRFETTIRLE